MHSTTIDGQGAKNETRSGIKVIVVGAGFGGLTAAIECHRQGHDVQVYEAQSELKPIGDLISFGANAGKIFNRWKVASDQRISELIAPISIDLRKHGFKLHKINGELIFKQSMPPADPESPMFNGHRGEIHAIILQYARTLGISLYLGSHVQAYSDAADAASIVLDTGESISGDVVIAADGVDSRAREHVLKSPDASRTFASGHKSFRAWFATTDVIADPETKHLCDDGDTFNGWVGRNTHLLFSTLKNGTECCWALTYKPAPDAQTFPSSIEESLAVNAGRILSWDLQCRDPLPQWISSNGRIALIGDAAHSMLPTSAQGAAQAMEDGVNLAICLRLAGKTEIPAALAAFQELRYERATAVQETGKTRSMWHEADWERAKRDPSSLNFPREDWIHAHDAERYAEETGPASVDRYRINDITA